MIFKVSEIKPHPKNSEIYDLSNINDLVLSIDEVGFPDYIDYEGSGGVVMSWCNMTMKNKKTGEIKVLKVHSQMSFNDSGSIVREDLYYNSNILN